jgi:hypothetical protein
VLGFWHPNDCFPIDIIYSCGKNISRELQF